MYVRQKEQANGDLIPENTVRREEGSLFSCAGYWWCGTI